MSQSPHIHNVSTQNFQAQVLDSSYQQPVLVDFWADWCQPCQTLMPILAQLADEYAGKFHLAKVNTEEQPELAAHFQIKSLPTMKLFVDGQAVGEQIGVVSATQIRALLDPYLHSETDAIMAAARQASAENREDEALALMNQALAQDPENADLKIDIAQLTLAQNDIPGAETLLGSLKDEDKKKPLAVQLRAEIAIRQQLKNLPSLAEIERRLTENADELAALIDKSTHLAAQGEYESAMDCLLQVMMLDRQYQDDAGRRGLLTLFDMLGGEHQAVQTYRRKVSALLH